MLGKLLEVNVWLIPAGLLITGLLAAWRHWRWPWRAALAVPFALALYALMAIPTAVFGTNLHEYDAIAGYLIHMGLAYAVAVILFTIQMAAAVAARLTRPKK